MSSERQLLKIIETERKSGKVICSCSDGSGFYLPKNKAEIMEFYLRTKKRAVSTLATLRSARKALQEMDGQIEFDDLEEMQ